MAENRHRSHTAGEDPLAQRLTSLGADVDRLRLASPADVRHRGDVRRRRQAAATGLAALLVVGVGAGVALQTTGGRDERPQLSVATAPKASPAPSASEPASALDPRSLARAALLHPSALGPDATAEDTFPQSDLNPCRYDSDQPTDAVEWRVLRTPQGAEVHQRVIVWPDVHSARASWKALDDDLLHCPAAAGRFGPLQVSAMPGPEGTGGPVAGWSAEMPAGAAKTQVYAAGFVDGRVTSEVYFTDPSAPQGSESVRQSMFHALTAEAAKRLIVALAGGTPASVTAPPSQADGPGAISPSDLLTAQEVEPQGWRWQEVSTYPGDGQSTVFSCQRTAFADAGSTSVLTREIGGPGTARAVSLLATFPDEKAAIAAVDKVVGSASRCSATLAGQGQQGAKVVDQGGQVPGADAAYLAFWPLGGTDGYFEYVAAGHRGSTVALVVMAHGGQDSNFEVPPTAAMLERALAKLG